MKASELAAGDWVMPLRKSISKPCQVISIYGGTNTCWINRDDYSGFLPCSEIEPIPLTSEILEKNGFTVCDEDENGAVQYEFGGNDLGVDVWLNTKPALLGAWRRWNNCNEPYSMVDELPINYIHELQHALRLCGIDKEIVI